MQVGISAIEYALPERRVALEQLESTDKLESPAARLREFGFEAVHVSDEPAERLVNVAVARLLENHAVSPDSVDALFYAGAIRRPCPSAPRQLARCERPLASRM